MILFLCFPLFTEAKLQSEDTIETAKSIVKKGLKDPGSAQFQELSILENSAGDTVVCGEFNARNSYGGYVGFQKFGVLANTYTTEIYELKRIGCYGPEAEISQRKQDAKDALAEQFRVESDFSCNVIWTMLDNHFRNRESIDSVVDAALGATINRASENGREIADPVLKMIRTQYESALLKTSNEKAQVKSIRRGDGMFKHQFVSNCILQTTQAMEAQVESGS